jgi:hypothetical protein
MAAMLAISVSSVSSVRIDADGAGAGRSLTKTTKQTASAASKAKIVKMMTTVRGPLSIARDDHRKDAAASHSADAANPPGLSLRMLTAATPQRPTVSRIHSATLGNVAPPASDDTRPDNIDSSAVAARAPSSWFERLADMVICGRDGISQSAPPPSNAPSSAPRLHPGEGDKPPAGVVLAGLMGCWIRVSTARADVGAAGVAVPPGGAAVGVAVAAGVGSSVAGFIVTLDLDATLDAVSCCAAPLFRCVTLSLFEVLPDGRS